MYEQSKKDFIRGYSCAVATLIHLRGLVDSEIRDLYQAGIGNQSLESLRKTIDTCDFEIFERYWGELN